MCLYKTLPPQHSQPQNHSLPCRTSCSFTLFMSHSQGIQDSQTILYSLTFPPGRSTKPRILACLPLPHLKLWPHAPWVNSPSSAAPLVFSLCSAWLLAGPSIQDTGSSIPPVRAVSVLLHPSCCSPELEMLVLFWSSVAMVPPVSPFSKRQCLQSTASAYRLCKSLLL